MCRQMRDHNWHARHNRHQSCCRLHKQKVKRKESKVSKKIVTEYCIYRDGHLVFQTRNRDLILEEIRRWFIMDSESAFEQGYFIADKNGIPICSDDDGKEYTQEEISKMDEWSGGEYVFPEDFTSYRDQDGILTSIEEEMVEEEDDDND